MPKLTEKNIGKWFEGKFQEMLEKMRSNPTDRSSYLRLYDSASARGKFLPAQPGDFMVAYSAATFMVECKSSVKYTTLRSCLSSHVKDTQVALMRMWIASGNPACFIFYSDVDKHIEIWPGKTVCEAKVSGKPLKKDGYVYRIPADSLESHLKMYMKMIKERNEL